MAQQYGVDIVAKVVNGSKVERLNRSLQGTAAKSVQASAGLNKASRSARNLGTSAGTATGGLDKLSAALGKAAAAYFALSKAAELAGNAIQASVARETAERQLSILAKQFGETDQALLLASKSAKKFGLGLTETTKQVTQVYARLRPLGATVSEIETVFNGFNTAARLGGSSASEAAGAFLQLSQALGSGYLRGQEFNSVAEQAPMVLQAIAKETGLAVGELKEFAAEGRITSDIVLRALKRIEDEGASQLAEALDTPQQAFKDLQVATENFNVALGNLIQPAVIAFLREAVSVLQFLTSALQGTQKVIQAVINLLQPLINIAQAASSAIEGLGISFRNFVGEVLKSLPGIGQAIRALELLNKLSGGKVGGGGGGPEVSIPDTSGLASSFSGGGISGADGGGAAAAVRESQVPQLQQELALKQRMFALDQQIAQQKLLDNQQAIRTLEIEKLKEQSALRQWEITQQKIPVEEMQLMRKLEELNLESQIAELNNQELLTQQEKQQQFQQILDDLNHQVDLSNETNDAARDLLEVERELAKLREQGVISTQAQADAYKSAALAAKGAGRKGQKGGMGKEILGTLKSGLGNVISTAIKGGDVKQALSDLFGQIADKFIDMALNQLFAGLEQALTAPAQKIVEGGADMAKAGTDVVSGAAEQVSAAAEGAASAALEQSASAQMTAAATQQVSAATQMVTAAAQQLAAAQIMAASGGGGFFAEGGFVDSPTKAMVGEGSSNEYIIPEDKMGSAMERYNEGARGSQVTEGASDSDGQQGLDVAEAPANINISGGIMQIDNSNYIRQDQLPSIISQASRQGEARALRKLQMSPAARRKAGVR